MILYPFSALTLLVVLQEEHPACKIVVVVIIVVVIVVIVVAIVIVCVFIVFHSQSETGIMRLGWFVCALYVWLYVCVHRITQKVWVDFGEIFKVDNFGMEMKSKF